MEKKKIWVNEDIHRQIKINSSKENMNMSEYVESLLEEKKELRINYLDYSYYEKRKKLRQYYYHDIDSFELVNYVINEVLKKEDIYLYINKEQFLIDLLIDGYVAYEIIFKDEKIINYISIDPTTLIVKYDKDRNKHWVQYNDNPELKRILRKDQILYISYSNDIFLGGHTSFVEQTMITDLSLSKNIVLIDILIEKLIKIYKTL